MTSLDRPPKRGWSLGSWLSGITRNHARQQVRGQQRRTRRERAAATPEGQPPDDSIERIDLLRHLLDQVRGLDEPYRSTILLRFFDGLSAKEVARRQGVPHATVRTRLHRGIEQLRQRMDDVTEGGRQAWVVPLIPFVSVPDGGLITTLAEGTSRLVQTSGQGVLAMSAKTQVVGLALVLGAGLLTVTAWPSLLGEPGVEDQGLDEPSSASIKQADPTPGALQGQPSVTEGRELIAAGKAPAPGKGKPPFGAGGPPTAWCYQHRREVYRDRPRGATRGAADGVPVNYARQPLEKLRVSARLFMVCGLCGSSTRPLEPPG